VRGVHTHTKSSGWGAPADNNTDEYLLQLAIERSLNRTSAEDEHVRTPPPPVELPAGYSLADTDLQRALRESLLVDGTPPFMHNNNASTAEQLRRQAQEEEDADLRRAIELSQLEQ
jgi:hypothetical protein